MASHLPGQSFAHQRTIVNQSYESNEPRSTQPPPPADARPLFSLSLSLLDAVDFHRPTPFPFRPAILLRLLLTTSALLHNTNKKKHKTKNKKQKKKTSPVPALNKHQSRQSTERKSMAIDLGRTRRMAPFQFECRCHHNSNRPPSSTTTRPQI